MTIYEECNNVLKKLLQNYCITNKCILYHFKKFKITIYEDVINLFQFNEVPYFDFLELVIFLNHY